MHGWKRIGFVGCILLALAVYGFGELRVGPGPRNGAQVLGMENAADSPILLTIRPDSGPAPEGDAGGLRLRVKVENRGTAPRTFSVCEAMVLCCIQGLHPLLVYGNEQIGLVDRCKNGMTPTTQEVVVAPGESYEASVSIPADYVPKEVRLGARPFTVVYCYELGDGRLIHSNALTASME